MKSPIAPRDKSPTRSATPTTSSSSPAVPSGGGAHRWGLMLLLIAALSPVSPQGRPNRSPFEPPMDHPGPVSQHDDSGLGEKSSSSGFRHSAHFYRTHARLHDRLTETAAFFGVEFGPDDAQHHSGAGGDGESSRSDGDARNGGVDSDGSSTPMYSRAAALRRSKSVRRRRGSGSAQDDEESDSADTSAVLLADGNSDDGLPIEEAECDISVSSMNRTPAANDRESPLPSVARVVVTPRSTLSTLPVSTLASALAYLPLNALERVRDGSIPEIAAAADYIAPRPFGTKDATFVRFAMDPTAVARHPTTITDASLQGLSRRARLAAVKGETTFEWRCLQCQNLTEGRKKCAHCAADIANSACRVFMGQLSKDATAELTAYMIRSLAPKVRVLHIESHTNGRDGRGKGCAWVYVDSFAEAERLTQLHKRVFVDADMEGSQGFWTVPNETAAAQLQAMADVVAALPERAQSLPRNLLVVEWQGQHSPAAAAPSFAQ